ncbi:MAG: D-alanyl-D-alanine carboxypeptidase [Lachnospiraceae bacterium]|nr:D-alanyl-D-alanine carboxypeptidase [Lachnospiraceae bacterium]
MTALLSVIAIILTACNNGVQFGFDPDSSDAKFNIVGSSASSDIKPFAADICVTDNNFEAMTLAIDEAEAGGLFDATDAETVYAKNAHNKLNPASLTKVMTAYIALKYGHLEDTLTASQNVLIKESGAQLLGIKEGDKMTLEQALNALLLYSANDAGVLIAEYLSGSVESFAAVMNDEALKLGATNTHFTNPHGLTDEEHYTTVYDLYLIFNAAMQYDEFRKIINTTEYKSTYKDREGNPKNIDIATTNSYLKGDVDPPAGVNVIGGKTGTTKAAKSCLIMLANGDNGHTYIAVVLGSTDHDSVYRNMTTLLTDIK